MRSEMYTVLDIETIPNSKMVNKLPEPDVKYGNTKDEEKRQAKRQEAKQEQIDKMALNPLYGRICCVALVSAGGMNYMIDDVDTDEKEKKIIEFIKSQAMDMSMSPKICTWNGLSFDIPFIYKRALILGVDMKVPMSHWMKRYSNIPHCDLMQLWCNWYGYEKLDNVASVLLGEGKKDFDVTTIKDLIKTGEGREKVAEYCIHDTQITWKILDKVVNILF